MREHNVSAYVCACVCVILVDLQVRSIVLLCVYVVLACMVACQGFLCVVVLCSYSHTLRVHVS